MELKESRAGSARIVSVDGDLDLASSPRLSSLLDRLVCERSALVVDLTNCTFIDSTGLAAILHGARPLVSFAVVCGDGVPGELLRMTSIDETIPVYPRLDEALEALDGSRAAR
jgi:anti-sigma B factor antagonist